MQYIEAIQMRNFVHPSVFLAGGITNCPDWQAEVKHLLRQHDVTIVNPRRADFPIGDPNAAMEQIEWEYDHLRKVDLISFWFSVGSLNPIVLFELGAALERDDVKVVVGCHPDYARKQDVQIQTGLKRPGIEVVYSLPELAIEILEEELHNSEVLQKEDCWHDWTGEKIKIYGKIGTVCSNCKAILWDGGIPMELLSIRQRINYE